mmetsp:Transcript_37539/g.93317  ORF Transcript_37539/g.93317 Transcript_37539/m.93317 type:complete len:262 (-) Transcript_37539:782-1567(-)
MTDSGTGLKHTHMLAILASRTPLFARHQRRADFSCIAQSSPKREPAVALSTRGGPTSATCPSCIVTTLSQCMMVSSRCAMVSVVAEPSWVRSVCWISASVSKSMLAVASSATITRDPLSSARAMQINWRSPAERLEPPASSGRSSPSGCLRTTSVIAHCSSALHSSASSLSLNGSRLARTEPVKRTGSCGMMERRERSVRRGSVAVSTPSISITPPQMLVRRKRLASSDDLPLPVRPQIPTFSPARMVKVAPLSTRGRSGR